MSNTRVEYARLCRIRPFLSIRLFVSYTSVCVEYACLCRLGQIVGRQLAAGLWVCRKRGILIERRSQHTAREWATGMPAAPTVMVPARNSR